MTRDTVPAVVGGLYKTRDGLTVRVFDGENQHGESVGLHWRCIHNPPDWDKITPDGKCPVAGYGAEYAPESDLVERLDD